MVPKKLERQELNALRLAMEDPGPAPGEIANAAETLAPAVFKTSQRLSARRTVRRSLRLQAGVLAGCCAAFAVLAGLAYEYRALLLASSAWRLMLLLTVLAFLAAGCLPLLLRKDREAN